MGGPIRFILNDDLIESHLHPGTVVLDFLRTERRLTGTKEGCREGDCGACAVLLGQLIREGELSVRYNAVNSCLLPLGDVEGKHLVSIEGINPVRAEGKAVEEIALTPVQKKMVEHGAIQCGFCTPGFVISLTGYLLGARPWSYEKAVEAVAGNICRCTGYASIKRAIADLLDYLEDGEVWGVQGARLEGSGAEPNKDHLRHLVACGVVPEYFLGIPERLRSLEAPGRMPRRSEKTSVVAGGTDLFVQRPGQMLEGQLSFLSSTPGYRDVRIEKERLILGAGVSMEEVKDIPELKDQLPGLADELSLIASAPIRRRATLGGNIINASPIGDFTVMLLALGAVLGLNSGRADREVPLDRFFRGYKQLDMKPGEVLQWIAVPKQPGRFSFEKVARRRHLDIASVNSAAWISIRGNRIVRARIAAGGVAPIPLFLSRTSACLEGQEPREERIEQALDLAQEEIAPISDVRGSEQYKRLLLRQLLLAHFQKLLPEQVHAEVWL
jgi:xanthine dehydrogenase small subunit